LFPVLVDSCRWSNSDLTPDQTLRLVECRADLAQLVSLLPLVASLSCLADWSATRACLLCKSASQARPHEALACLTCSVPFLAQVGDWVSDKRRAEAATAKFAALERAQAAKKAVAAAGGAGASAAGTAGGLSEETKTPAGDGDGGGVLLESKSPLSELALPAAAVSDTAAAAFDSGTGAGLTTPLLQQPQRQGSPVSGGAGASIGGSSPVSLYSHAVAAAEQADAALRVAEEAERNAAIQIVLGAPS
jgi:hypothetical protein